MKKLFYSLLVFPLIMACGAEEVEDESTNESNDVDAEQVEVDVESDKEILNKFIIKTSIVGIFEVGKPVPSKLPEELKMRQFLEEDTDDQGKTTEHKHNVIFNPLEDVVELIMERDEEEHHVDKQIEEMMVLSNYYETDLGIHVGSTAEAFKELYPNATVWYDGIHDRYYLEAESLVGVQFIIGPSFIKRKVNTSKDFLQINFSYLKENAEIIKIRVF